MHTRHSNTTTRTAAWHPLRLLGWLAGVDLHQHPNAAAVARRLVWGRGLAQVYSSAITAAGLLCFVLLAQQQWTWNWSLFGGLWAAVLVFDAVFNLMLNLTGRGLFALLLSLRVMLTVALGYFTANTLSLMTERQATAPIALRLAEADFASHTLAPLLAALQQSQAALQQQQSQAQSFETTQAQTPGSSTPTACQYAAVTLSEDMALRQAQLRQQRQQERACTQALAQQQATQAQQLAGQAQLRQALQDQLQKTQQDVNTARTHLQQAEKRQATDAAAMAAGLPYLLRALAEVHTQHPVAHAQYLALLMAIYTLEFLALLFKVSTARLDALALSERASLLQASLAPSLTIDAAIHMHQAAPQARRSAALGQQAQRQYRHELHHHLQAQAALRRAKRVAQDLANRLRAAAHPTAP